MKLGVGLAAVVDSGIGIDDRLAEGVGGAAVEQLVIGVRHAVAGQFAGQFAGGVGAHAVGHHKDVAALAPVALVARQGDANAVLIVGAPQANVAEHGVLEEVVPAGGGFNHESASNDLVGYGTWLSA